MQPIGRSIRLFLVDGVEDSLKTAEIANWTGHVIAAPRTQLPRLLARPEIKKTGVYILFGPDLENPDKKKVYIGESDNVGSRLQQHDANEAKDFWEDTLAIVSKDNNLTKSHARYLESRMIETATVARRATIVNGNSPASSNFLPEAEAADMEFFLAQVIMLLPVLGFDFATQFPRISPQVTLASTTAITGINTQPLVLPQQSSPLFELRYNGAYALAQQVGSVFFVLKDSTALISAVPSFETHNYFRIRRQLIDEGKLIPNENHQFLVATTDIPFKSPSAAAAAICGRAANGQAEWRVASTNQTYRDWQNSQFSPDDQTNSPDDGKDEQPFPGIVSNCR